jgi:hypothetical protein
LLIIKLPILAWICFIVGFAFLFIYIGGKYFGIKEIKLSEEEEIYEEGTKVSSDLNGGFKGEIVGIAVNRLPVMGITYIIKISERIGESWKNYPYSCVATPESNFTDIQRVNKENVI